MMIRTILVAAAALASISFDPGHAEGALAPYCAVISLGTGSVYWDCQYYSFEDCYRRGNILGGNRGFCNAQPVLRRWTRATDPETCSSVLIGTPRTNGFKQLPKTLTTPD
jgi:hypothetical protein